MKKAVVFFADGTEECEALLVVDLLRRANVQVTVASASGRLELETSHGIRMTADALAEELDYTEHGSGRAAGRHPRHPQPGG